MFLSVFTQSTKIHFLRFTDSPRLSSLLALLYLLFNFIAATLKACNYICTHTDAYYIYNTYVYSYIIFLLQISINANCVVGGMENSGGICAPCGVVYDFCASCAQFFNKQLKEDDKNSWIGWFFIRLGVRLHHFKAYFSATTSAFDAIIQGEKKKNRKRYMGRGSNILYWFNKAVAQWGRGHRAWPSRKCNL